MPGGAPITLARETDSDKIGVILDNARFHRPKVASELYEPGEALELIRPILPASLLPDHNPIDKLLDSTKTHISSTQKDTPSQTCTAFKVDITNRTFNYNVEHPPTQ